MDNDTNGGGVAIESTPLLVVHDRFKHLDMIFRSVGDDETVFHQTCRDLWVAICDAAAAQSTANGRHEPARKKSYE